MLVEKIEQIESNILELEDSMLLSAIERMDLSTKEDFDLSVDIYTLLNQFPSFQNTRLSIELMQGLLTHIRINIQDGDLNKTAW